MRRPGRVVPADARPLKKGGWDVSENDPMQVRCTPTDPSIEFDLLEVVRLRPDEQQCRFDYKSNLFDHKMITALGVPLTKQGSEVDVGQRGIA
jgi:hypothetical protein